MKKITKLTAFVLCLGVLSFSSMAYAESKTWIWSWPESHWDKLDFIPYLEDGKRPHNSQWAESGWKVSHWTAQRKSSMDLIKGFYFADILRGQYVDDDIPVLEVGPAFYMLGGQDKRRVVQTVDHVYGITAENPLGMFLLHDWKSGEAIGTYTKYGLQLQ